MKIPFSNQVDNKFYDSFNKSSLKNINDFLDSLLNPLNESEKNKEKIIGS